jgi:hypothetical protein
MSLVRRGRGRWVIALPLSLSRPAYDLGRTGGPALNRFAAVTGGVVLATRYMGRENGTAMIV